MTPPGPPLLSYLKNFSPNLDFSSWGWEEAPAKQNYQMLETPCVMWSFMDRYLLPYCPAPDVSIQVRIGVQGGQGQRKGGQGQGQRGAG